MCCFSLSLWEKNKCLGWKKVFYASFSLSLTLYLSVSWIHLAINVMILFLYFICCCCCSFKYFFFLELFQCFITHTQNSHLFFFQNEFVFDSICRENENFFLTIHKWWWLFNHRIEKNFFFLNRFFLSLSPIWSFVCVPFLR